MFRSWPELLWRVGPVRAVFEAVGINTILLIFLLLDVKSVPALSLTLMWLGTICGLICALRTRLAGGSRRIIIRHEMLTVLLLAFATGLSGLLLLPDAAIALIAMGGSIIPLIFVRAMAYTWRAWRALQQQQLVWAVTNAQLMTILLVLALALLASILSMGPELSYLSGLGVSGPLTRLVIWLLSALTFFVLTTSLAIPLIALLMPVAILLSYLTARRMTRRITALGEAAASLRSGQYSTRVPVEGQDEIARLQHDFNNMAAELERAHGALKAERDTVAGLLQNRRELIALVSHELRTPVSTIRGHLDSDLENWQDVPPPTLHHDLTVMQQETARLQTLIEDLFALSRAEVGQLTLRCVPTALTPLIEGAVQAIGPLAWARGRIEVITDLEPGLPMTLVDARRFDQILHNLLHNSLRHTPPGGIVAVVACAEGSDRIRVEVCDTGEGIMPGDLPHIWERFYRGSGAHEGGAGLGLAVVKELAEVMGGTVGVESAPGKGSRFRVVLRRA